MAVGQFVFLWLVFCISVYSLQHERSISRCNGDYFDTEMCGPGTSITITEVVYYNGSVTTGNCSDDTVLDENKKKKHIGLTQTWCDGRRACEGVFGLPTGTTTTLYYECDNNPHLLESLQEVGLNFTDLGCPDQCKIEVVNAFYAFHGAPHMFNVSDEYLDEIKKKCDNTGRCDQLSAKRCDPKYCQKFVEDIMEDSAHNVSIVYKCVDHNKEVCNSTLPISDKKTDPLSTTEQGSMSSTNTTTISNNMDGESMTSDSLGHDATPNEMEVESGETDYVIPLSAGLALLVLASAVILLVRVLAKRQRRKMCNSGSEERGTYSNQKSGRRHGDYLGDDLIIQDNALYQDTEIGNTATINGANPERSKNAKSDESDPDDVILEDNATYCSQSKIITDSDQNNSTDVTLVENTEYAPWN